MLELLPISFTFTSLVKVLLIIGINTFLGYTWYSPIGFKKQWMEAVQWKEGDTCSKKAILMSHIGTLLSSFLLNILLIAFDIRKHQFVSAILASAILCGFYAVSSEEFILYYIEQCNISFNLILV
jgi:hypothetical protein